MAALTPGQEIQRRAAALAQAVNSALTAHYAKNKTAAADQLSVTVSGAAESMLRSPEAQAKEVLEGQSWTCNSSHMSDAARHILVRRGTAVTWGLNHLKATYPVPWGVLENAWNNAMAAQNLVNFSGAARFGFPGADPLHLEMPNSRLADTDPRVTRCLEVYAQATRIDGKPKNNNYETNGSQYQRTWLQNYDANLAKQKAKGP